MRQTFFQIFILAFIFIVAFVLEIMPWPNDFQGYRPTWVVLVLLYWALALPDKVSVGTAFVVGIIWDLVVGSILGIHALVQSLLVMLYVILIRFMIFFIEMVLNNAEFNNQQIVGAIISGILWPWVFLLMRQVRHQLRLH